jgi:2-dehydro-3-deoxyphosphogluconate aldolase / (4S)-4-hydroxy-2-oxoglutarate aldolase
MSDPARAGSALAARIPQLQSVPAIGILRGCPLDRVEAVVGAAVEAGLGAVEVTFGSEQPGRQIALLRQAFPDVAVGAGTVLTLDDLREAVDRGATFAVTPVVDEEIIAASVELGTPCLPGAATATEVWRAHRAGATAVKVFPAEQLGGPAYVRALREPLALLELVPTGGIDAGNVRAYLQAGAVAVGIGSGLFPRDAMRDGDVASIIRAVAALVEHLR